LSIFFHNGSVCRVVLPAFIKLSPHHFNMVDLTIVTDPTDWKFTELPFIASVDAALRCEVCKDFYTAPVITNCCHTFCSLCIRRALNTDGICPICRTSEQEYRLRKNTTVQDLLDAFVVCRPQLYDFAIKESERATMDDKGQQRTEIIAMPSSSHRAVQSQRGTLVELIGHDAQLRPSSSSIYSMSNRV
jgi:DNA repair protein Rad18